jgi:3-oxoacyl-(acyl-carrier-protein) reductase
MTLENKVALVTGAGQGIGKATALMLAGEGADVIVNDVTVKAAEATAREIEKLGKKTLVHAANVAVRQQVEEMFALIETEFGRIDILVNNAGITRDGFLLNLTEEEWDLVMDVNLKGVFNCTQLAARMMSEQNAGRIVNLSSATAQMGNIGQVNYAASKGGVISVTKTLARELAQFNINVNAVAPGFIETPMTDSVPDKVKKQFVNSIPLKRMGKPQDVAKVIKFLVTEDSAYITGQTIACNGGLFM